MVTLVIVFNLLISVICLFVAWQIWNLRLALAATTRAITDAQHNTHKNLFSAPEAITQGQLGVKGLRDSYQQLEVQLQQVQKVLVLLGLVQKIWLGRLQPIRRSKRLKQ
jgi:hypothetical protein